VSPLSRADAYGRHTGRYAPELAANFLRFAGVSSELQALDVGCGPGALTDALTKRVGSERVAAVDPSEEYAEACRQRLPGVDVRVGAGEDLPFEDGTFDAVLAQLVVQALDDAPRAAQEMLRVTAPGGLVAACVWDFRAGMPLLVSYWGAALAVDPDGARRAGADDANPWCTPEGLRCLWREAGMKEVETGELSASARYEGVDDAWWSFEAGVGSSGAYCGSLDEPQRASLRKEFRRRLGVGEGPFRLTARAWAVRGQAPPASG
jgi:ubiquinone/menaquinone biosynthesis C-methylase UbiE